MEDEGKDQPAEAMAGAAAGLEIHYDGGYSQAHRLAVWAVVITDGQTTELAGRGYLEGPGVHIGEREALAQAVALAQARGIKIIRGDSLEHNIPIPTGITLKRIPSHHNQADPHTKTYPNWRHHQTSRGGG